MKQQNFSPIVTHHPAQLYLMMRKQHLKIAAAQAELKQATEAVDQFYSNVKADSKASKLFNTTRHCKKAKTAGNVLQGLGLVGAIGSVFTCFATQSTGSRLATWISIGVALVGLGLEMVSTIEHDNAANQMRYGKDLDTLKRLQYIKEQKQNEVDKLNKELMNIENCKMDWIDKNGKKLSQSKISEYVVDLVDVFDFATPEQLQQFVGLPVVVDDEHMLRDIMAGKVITLGNGIAIDSEYPEGKQPEVSSLE